MNEYYCHKCAETLGFLPTKIEMNYTGSSVQLDKFIKHTMPSTTYKINSIFNTNDYDKFKNYIIVRIKIGTI
jgi:hypothetical protein